MSDVMGRFCPVCGASRPAIVSRRVHLTKNQRFRCRECSSEFTVHVDERENQADRFLKHVSPPKPLTRGHLYFLDEKGGILASSKEKKR